MHRSSGMKGEGVKGVRNRNFPSCINYPHTRKNPHDWPSKWLVHKRTNFLSSDIRIIHLNRISKKTVKKAVYVSDYFSHSGVLQRYGCIHTQSQSSARRGFPQIHPYDLLVTFVYMWLSCNDILNYCCCCCCCCCCWCWCWWYWWWWWWWWLILCK